MLAVVVGMAVVGLGLLMTEDRHNRGYHELAAVLIVTSVMALPLVGLLS